MSIQQSISAPFFFFPKNLNSEEMEEKDAPSGDQAMASFCNGVALKPSTRGCRRALDGHEVALVRSCERRRELRCVLEPGPAGRRLDSGVGSDILVVATKMLNLCAERAARRSNEASGFWHRPIKMT